MLGGEMANSVDLTVFDQHLKDNGDETVDEDVKKFPNISIDRNGKDIQFNSPNNRSQRSMINSNELKV